MMGLRVEKWVWVLLLIWGNAFCQTDLSLEQAKKMHQKMMWFYRMPQYDLDSSTYYFNKSVALLDPQKQTHLRELGKLYYYRIIFLETGEKPEPIAKKGWSYVSKLTDDSQYNRALKFDFLTCWAQNIAVPKSEYKRALALFNQALSYTQPNDSKAFKNRVTLCKGVFYRWHELDGQEPLAYRHLLEAKKYYDGGGKEKYTNDKLRLYVGLSSVHTDKNLDSTLYYQHKIKTLAQQYQTPFPLAFYYATHGRELITHPLDGAKSISKQQYAQGRAEILQAIALLERYRMQSPVYPYCLGLLADLDFRDGKYDEAIANFTKSRNFHLKSDDIRFAIDILPYIAKSYQAKGDLVNAIKFKDQWYAESLAFEQRKNERSLREGELEVDMLRQEKELARRQNVQQVFVVALAVGALVLLLVYRNNRLKKKSNRELALINHELGQKNDLLDKRNAEKELLLKEIHHRVKNNLEIVSSLLALQSAQVNDEATKDAMIEVQNRVNSIGIVHQKLYQGTSLGSIEMKDYLFHLGENILDSFGAENRVELKLEMETLELDIDTAVPLGLILNELLTNAVKYAFPDGRNGTITIQLKKRPDALHLEVSDNGIGKSGATHGTGFGSQLIALLTNQLNGTMLENNDNGTVVIFEFKRKPMRT